MGKPFDYKELSARVRSLLSIKATHEKKVEEEKSGALEQMMDQVAHEIRNPLTAIGGFARKVYGRLEEADPNKKYMQMIIEDVAVLEGMIKQLIELKTMAISCKEPTDINEVIRESLKVFEQDFVQNAINIETDLTDNLPMVLADGKILKRAFCNIIKNSIEAMETTQGGQRTGGRPYRDKDIRYRQRHRKGHDQEHLRSTRYLEGLRSGTRPHICAQDNPGP
jgi:two-component system sensor histidine kinase/response regulator